MRASGVALAVGSAFVAGYALSKWHSSVIHSSAYATHIWKPKVLSTTDAELAAQTQIGSYFAGSLNAAMVYIGDSLDLYRHIHTLQNETADSTNAGATPTAVANASGLHERWVREWMYQQCACGILNATPLPHPNAEPSFTIAQPMFTVLTDRENIHYACGLLSGLPFIMERVVSLPTSFATGNGLSYDAGGVTVATAIEREHVADFKHFLVQKVIETNQPGPPGPTVCVIQGWQIRWVAKKYGKNMVKYAILYRIFTFFNVFLCIFSRIVSRPNVSAKLGVILRNGVLIRCSQPEFSPRDLTQSPTQSSHWDS